MLLHKIVGSIIIALQFTNYVVALYACFSNNLQRHWSTTIHQISLSFGGSERLWVCVQSDRDLPDFDWTTDRGPVAAGHQV